MASQFKNAIRDRQIHARCSSLPLLEACSQAGAETDLTVQSARGAADVGTAAHAVLTHWVRHGQPREAADDIMDTATRFGVDTEELEHLVWTGWRAWKQIAEFFPDPQTEVELVYDGANGVRVTGHADVMSVVGNTIRILDFKTGRLDEDHWSQVKAYGFLAVYDPRWFKAEHADLYVLRVRDMTLDRQQFTAAELESWFSEMLRRLDDTAYRPGRHCSYCPRSLTCPAVAEIIAQAVEVLEKDVVDPTLQLGFTYDALKLLEKWSERAKEAIRAIVAAKGPQDLGDGRQLALVETKRTEIHYDAGEEVLTTAVGADRLRKILKVSKTAVEAAVKESAPRGGKGIAVQTLLGELDAAGALTKTTIERLECRRVETPKALTERTA